MTRRRRVKERAPKAMAGLVTEEMGKDELGASYRYLVQYDCPWCGKEHNVKLNDNPPAQITPNCGKGPVYLHRADFPAD